MSVTQPHVVSEPQTLRSVQEPRLQITHCCIPLLRGESAGVFRASLQFVVVAGVLVPSSALRLRRLVGMRGACPTLIPTLEFRDVINAS